MNYVFSKLSGLCLVLSIFTSPVQAQFKWSSTNGSPGASWAEYLVEHDDSHYYISNGHTISRTNDGICWDVLDETPIHVYHGSGGVLIGIVLEIDDFRTRTGGQAFLSYDHGDSWQSITLPPLTTFWLYPGRSAFASPEALYIIDSFTDVVYVSTDAGMSWQSFAPPLAVEDYVAWFPDFTGGDFYYHTQGEVFTFNEDFSDWETVATPESMSYVWDIYINGDLHFYSTHEKLWYSYDGGETFDFHPLSDGESYDNFATKGDRIYALDQQQMVYSDDQGASWTIVDEDDALDLSFNAIAVVGEEILCTTYARGLLRFNESDESFDHAICGVSSNTGTFAYAGTDLWVLNNAGFFNYNLPTQAWDTTARRIEPLQELTYLAVSEDGKMASYYKYGASILYYSEDQGASWTILVLPEEGGSNVYRIRDFAFVGEQLYILGETSFQYIVYRYEGGSDWTELYEATHLNLIEGNDGMIYTTHEGNLVRATEVGDPWQVIGPLPFNGKLYITEDAFFLGSQTTELLYVSFDEGVTWRRSTDGLNLNPTYNLGVQGVYQVDSIFVLDLDDIIYGSKDSCQTWLPIERRLHEDFTFIDDKFYKSSSADDKGIFQSPPPNVYGNVFRGLVYWDKNEDLMYDPNDQPLQSIKVGPENPLNYNHFFVLTDEAGEYNIGLREAIGDTIRARIRSLNPDYYVVTPAFYLQTETMEETEGLDFAVSFTADITDLDIRGYHFPNARPGFDSQISIHHQNHGTTAPATVISCKLDERLTYLSAAPQPTTIIGDSLIWELPEVGILTSDRFQVMVNVPASVPLGDTLLTRLYTSPDSPDAEPADNVAIIKEGVIGAYDPNDKRVFPAQGLTASEIAAGKPVEFMIRFQNTGTFYAERVRITDKIDTAFNWNTLELIAASHEVTAWELKPGGLLEVVFDQIFLPDSTTNEPESHGFISFTIERNKNYNEHYRVTNQASIYFDFNEPIITNEVAFRVPEEVVGTREATSDLKLLPALEIFPNPTTRDVNIIFDENIGSLQAYAVFNQLGQRVRHGNLNNIPVAPLSLSLDQLPAGMYVLKIAGDRGAQSGKVVLVSGAE